jgi:tetratricopeptide (TPR) repeat protein
MSTAFSSPTPRLRWVLLGGGLAALCLVAVVVGGGAGYFLDQGNYAEGHRAYEQGDCAAAVGYFDRVINGWRLMDFGGYVPLAAQEKQECLAFQPAVDRQTAGDASGAVVAYDDFVSAHAASPLTAEARRRVGAIFAQTDPATLISREVCDRLEALLAHALLPQPDQTLPLLYLACGQLYTADGDPRTAYGLYVAFLSDYPEHPLAAGAATALLANPAACEDASALESNAAIADRPDFLPSLYYNCGQAYEQLHMYAEAIGMYEAFLRGHAGHPLAEAVKAALARALVEAAEASGAGEIAPPERSGSTGDASAMVIIQNDSPEQLRLVFSGPEAQIEELEACAACERYSLVGPAFCPEKGPIGRYTLQPGDYDVLVETIGGGEVTPFTGKWQLSEGSEYYSCFFIVTTLTP